jgi:hypothetical protein
MTKLIINVETGKTTERQLNESENDQQKADELIDAKQQALIKKAAADKAALLARLGLTEDELKTILG